jgi:hypothetical protein
MGEEHGLGVGVEADVAAPAALVDAAVDRGEAELAALAGPASLGIG